MQTIVSMAILGAAAGSIFGGPFSDKFGRKPTILVADVLFVVGAVVMSSAPTIAILILGRILVGVIIKVKYTIVWSRNSCDGCSCLLVRSSSY